MKKIFAKFILTIMVGSFLSLSIGATSLALVGVDDDPPAAPSTTEDPKPSNDPAAADPFKPKIQNNDVLKNTKFSVTKVLSLDNKDQKNTVFDNKNTPPIIALIIKIIEFATRVIGSIAIIILIIGGFMFMFSQGNEQNLTNAKDVLKYAAIGLAVTFLSFIIVLAVQSLFYGAGV